MQRSGERQFIYSKEEYIHRSEQEDDGKRERRRRRRRRRWWWWWWWWWKKNEQRLWWSEEERIEELIESSKNRRLRRRWKKPLYKLSSEYSCKILMLVSLLCLHHPSLTSSYSWSNLEKGEKRNEHDDDDEEDPACFCLTLQLIQPLGFPMIGKRSSPSHSDPLESFFFFLCHKLPMKIQEKKMTAAESSLSSFFPSFEIMIGMI